MGPVDAFRSFANAVGLTGFFDRRFPPYAEDAARLDAQVLSTLVDVEERARERAAWVTVLQREALPPAVEERERHARRYAEVAGTMREWAKSPYDPSLRALQWGDDAAAAGGAGGRVDRVLKGVRLPGPWAAQVQTVGGGEKC